MAGLAGMALCASVAAAEEPLQFNVPYHCQDGTDNIITRCQAYSKGEICYWRVEKNGQLIGERYNKRSQMDGWLKVCKVRDATVRAQPGEAQMGNAAPTQAQVDAVRRAYEDAQAKARQAAPAAGAAEVKPGSQLELRRCIASGRSQRVCFSEVLANGVDRMTGISLKIPSTPGLRMTGDYSGPGGLRVIFQPDKATLVCRGVPSPLPYTVEVTETRALVKIEQGTGPVVLTLREDGKLAGAGSVTVTGQVPTGSTNEQTAGMTTQKTTRQRELTPLEAQNYPEARQNGQTFTTTEEASELVYGSTGTRTVTSYQTKSAACKLGLLTPTGPTPLPPDIESPFGLITTIFSGTAVLMNGGSQEKALGEMLNLDKAPAPGLRMSGKYVGAGGFSITFHPESVTLACRDAERAHEYGVEKSAGRIQLKIQDKSHPVVLQVQADGSLYGAGSVQVDGREIVGTTEDPQNPFIFAPKVDLCKVGSLTAAKQGGAGSEFGGPAPVDATEPPDGASSTPATEPAAPSTAQVSLSLRSGFPPRADGVNPLAGRIVLVLRESFEDILTRAGLGAPGPKNGAISAWARACEARQPLCQQGIEAMRPSLVASAKLDGKGEFTIANGQAGTFYLVLQITYNGTHLVWNLPVRLRPGTNEITLGQGNTTPIER